MTSNTRLSILKPGRPREPLQDLSQLIPNNEEEETTTTDNHKRRVSFAAVNKVKEFETGAECTTLHQTPAYDERFSTSSDSYQSSMSEYSHNKSTFMTAGNSSVTLNRNKINDENIDIVEVNCNNSKVVLSSGKMNAGDSNMDITSMIVREEYIDYESNSESYLPLNLTKSRQSTQSIEPEDSDDNKDILETSSMETTEALPCMMTETIMTDVSVEEIGVEEEHNYGLSINPTIRSENMIHLRESTVLVTDKDVQFTIDTLGDIKNAQFSENIFIQKQDVNLPTVESSAMEEDTSLNIQNRIIDKENLMISGNTCTEDGSDSQLEETEIVEREMDISIKDTFCFISNVLEVTEKDVQSEVSTIGTQENILFENTNLENNPVEVAESIFTEEQNLRPEKNVEKEENLLFVKNITVEMEKTPLLVDSVAENSVIDHEHVESIQNSILSESVENPAIEESSFLHDEILSIELQNCQLIENTRIEEEKSLNVDESKINEKIFIEKAVHTEENTPSSLKIITLEENLISNISVGKNILKEEIEQPAEKSVVEMEVSHLAENFDKNNDVNVESSKKCSEDVISSRPLKRKSDSFVPEIPPLEPSPKKPNTEINLKIVRKNETVQNQVEKAIKKKEILYWTVVSLSDTEWKFGTLWNRLHLIVSLSETDVQCVSKLRFVKKDSGIGDEILKVAIAPIIRKYRKKMDELCGRVEDVAIFMKMTLPSINFAQRFAEDFSEIIEFESISLDNGFASFLVANYKSHLLAKIQVDMRNIEDFSDSSFKVVQNIGSLDDTLVRRIFFEARGDFDFFSKFVNNLNRELNS